MDATLVAGTALRVGTGLFFACSGYNKLFNHARHAALVKTLEEDKVPERKFMQWWVPGWELSGGTMLATGMLPRLGALALLVIMLVALFSEGKKRVQAYAPINAADRVCDWLYLPELIYALVLATFVVA